MIPLDGAPSARLAIAEPEVPLKLAVGFAWVKLGLKVNWPPPNTNDPPPVAYAIFRMSPPTCTECLPNTIWRLGWKPITVLIPFLGLRVPASGTLVLLKVSRGGTGTNRPELKLLLKPSCVSSKPNTVARSTTSAYRDRDARRSRIMRGDNTVTLSITALSFVRARGSCASNKGPVKLNAP